MIATARCFVYPNFKVNFILILMCQTYFFETFLQVTAILKPILRDEMVLSRMKKPEDATQVDKLTDSEQIVNMVNKAVTSISSRLNNLALFDGVESKVGVLIVFFFFRLKKLLLNKSIFQVGTLVAAASSHDNLCRMDPAWHPWL